MGARDQPFGAPALPDGFLQMITRLLLIKGRVQGVGFRDALCEEAERLGLRGWVRNRTAGNVEALVQGAEGPVLALVSWARRGPPLARVDGVEVEVIHEADPEPSFRRLPTA
jgi:acylphosphatase